MCRALIVWLEALSLADDGIVILFVCRRIISSNQTSMLIQLYPWITTTPVVRS